MRHRDRHGAGIFAGLVFLAMGVILLIGNLDVFPVQPLFSQWWPVLLILIGMKTLLLIRRPNAWIAAAFWIGTGALFLSSTLGFLTLSIPALIWPVVLIWFGVFTLLGCGGGCARYSREGSGS